MTFWPAPGSGSLACRATASGIGTTAWILICSAVLLASPGAAAGADSPAQGGRSDPSSGWSAGVAADLRQREYHVTWQTRTVLDDLPEAWHAPNRSQGFRTYFTDDGIRLVPRVGEVPDWEWGLALAAAGREGPPRRVETARLAAEGNRLTYDRAGVVERYVNSPRGLEQIFTLAAPPEEIFEGSPPAASAPALGPGGSGRRLPPGEDRGGEQGIDPGRPVFLNLLLSGGLSPRVAADGQALDFLTPGGARVLRYAGLEVRDAAGRRLEAWMEARAHGGSRWVRILFDDDGAVYPVTVDPLVSFPAWTAGGGQGGSRFGISVATAGDVNGDLLSDVIVGADGYDNGQAGEGRAFVFLGTPSGLSSTPAWTAESDQADARFGISVATAGDVNGDGFSDVIIGADGYDNGQADEGRAFVFLGSASGLPGGPEAGPGDADWTAESDQAGAHLGISVATAGDVNGDLFSDVIVGADRYANGEAAEGRAFVFLGSASGLPGGPRAGPGDAGWTAESDQADARLGVSVALAGDVNGDGFSDVIVGADQYDDTAPDEGRVFVFHGSASGLPGGPAAGPADASWLARGTLNDNRFGHSVATAGDVNGDGFSDVIIGAHQYSFGQFQEGRVYIYLGSGSGLAHGPSAGPQHAAWRAESDKSTARFGVSVATAGDLDGDGYADVVIGADLYDNGEIDEGAAFVYFGSPTGPPGGQGAGLQDAGWVVEGGQAGAGLGVSVATAGDVDGDSLSDVIVGAAFHDGGEVDEGRALVFPGDSSDTLSGGPATSTAAAAWTVQGAVTGESLGLTATTVGDVNGDGYADVLVGSTSYDNGQTNEGAVWVFHGSGSGPSGGSTVYSYDADWRAEGEQANSRFGFSAGPAGDVNGDGYDDIIVGAYQLVNGEINEGGAFVYLGSPAGLQGGPAAVPADAHWRVESDQAYALMGWSVATAGDVNGDGISDVIVGARLYDGPESNEGRAFVFHGSPAGLPGAPFAGVGDADWIVESNQASALLGQAVATAGDVNGDGFSDVIVGAPGYESGQTDEGRALVYLGSPSGLAGGPLAGPGDAAWWADGDLDYADFGQVVGTAGDVNGDGFSDVVVGAESYSSASDGGRVFVYHGSPAGLPASADWMARSDEPHSRFGSAAGTAGDVNGDGFADLIVGARLYDNGVHDSGAAFVFRGSATGLPGGPLASPADAAWWVWSDQTGADAQLGVSASAAGDVNGDGFGDVIVGAPYFNGGGLFSQGGAFVFLGNPGVEPGPRPRQLKADGSGPIAHLGASDTADGFRIDLTGRTAFGRGLVRLEWEVKPLGVLFDGAGTQTTAGWQDTGTAGVAFSSQVTGLTERTVYHWRARLVHHPATTPFQPAGRWITIPRDGWEEADLRTALPPGIGDRVWRDSDADGIQDPGEPGIGGILVELLDGGGPPGTVLDSVLTDPNGIYGFPGLPLGDPFVLRVIPPSGFDSSPADQEDDDTLDSDIDPVTFLSPVIQVEGFLDPVRWDAGLVPDCAPPEMAVEITEVELDQAARTRLTFLDGNPPNQVTGYNVYRSSDPASPAGTWTQLALDAGDEDAGRPGIQWLDGSAGAPPGGVWYYHVTAYNNLCPAEGPF